MSLSCEWSDVVIDSSGRLEKTLMIFHNGPCSSRWKGKVKLMVGYYSRVIIKSRHAGSAEGSLRLPTKACGGADKEAKEMGIIVEDLIQFALTKLYPRVGVETFWSSPRLQGH